MEHRLNEREQNILRLVIKSFIDTAGPVGSRYLSKRYDLGLSPASIRNAMADLEDMGYLGHPYTSAGRVPTERGYRTFVDDLMETPELTPAEKAVLKARLDDLMGGAEELTRETSHLLGQLSSLLGVALTPRLSKGVLERLDIVPLSSSRLMFVLSVRGGFVRTIVLEFNASLRRSELDRIVSILNERLAGLTLEEIRATCEERTRDIEPDASGIVRLMLEESGELFSEPSEGRLRYAGTQQMITQPEFQEPEVIRELIDLLENEAAVVHLLEDHTERTAQQVGRATISIGSENHGEKVGRYSIVTAPYRVGDTTGTIGVLGPTRMDYERVVALVEGMAALLSQDPSEAH